jgi:hypothetical protein
MKPTQHLSWIIASLVLVFLAVTVVTLVDDVLSQRQTEDEISTITDRLNERANLPAGEITAGVTLGQTFRATEPNLDSVEIMLATYQRTNTSPLLFSLYEYPAEAPLRTVVAEPDSIRDNKYRTFEFASIPDSAGKAFLLTLESPEAIQGDAFTAWLSECDCYQGGTALLSGEEQPGRDLAFRVGYHNEVTSVLSELINRMSQYKPWFFKGVPLATLGLLSLALALLAVGSFTSSLLRRGERQIEWPWIPAAGLIIVAVSLWFVLG